MSYGLLPKVISQDALQRIQDEPGKTMRDPYKVKGNVAETLDAILYSSFSLHAKHRINTTCMYNNGVHYISSYHADEWTAICACMYCKIHRVVLML